MALNKEARLLQQAEKIVLHPIHPHLISYCPTMDLIALVTDEENLDVYRVNGQKAFGLQRKSEDDTIDAICWEFNGRAIAVAWSDGYTDIVSAETGKVIHKDLPPPESAVGGTSRTVCIGWGLNFIDVEVVKRRTGESRKKKWTRDSERAGTRGTIDLAAPTSESLDVGKNDASLEDFLARQPDLQALDVAPGLPDQLAMMDTETLLPKLPAIPLPPALPFMRVPQTDSGTFSSQAQVDGLLHSSHMKDHNSVDMFIRCTEKGTVHPSIYDFLETVDIHLPASWKLETKPILHTSHPYSCSHALLTEVTDFSSQKRLAFVPLTLGFMPSAGVYLHLIAAKTSQLQNLLLYVQQSFQRTCTFWRHSQDLPSKFMRNISETLAEKDQGDLMQNLFHLACTGNCPPLIHEWLVDELAEQGHKRWDTTVTSSLTTVLSLIHENLMPALDRCSIVISRLRGLAEFHDRDWIFSGPISDFTSLLELIKNLRLLAHTCLLYATDEKRQFSAFSRWLRFCIDFEATEPESQSRQEMEARDPGVDIALVLEYIQHGLTKSDLTAYLRPETELGIKKDAGAASYEDTCKAVDLLKQGAGWKEESLCMEHVLRHLSGGVKNLLSQVSSWQEINTTMNCGLALHQLEGADLGFGDRVDMRMVFEIRPKSFTKATTDDCTPEKHPANTHFNPSQPALSPDENITTYIAVSPPSSPALLHLHRLVHRPTISTLPSCLLDYSTVVFSFASPTPTTATVTNQPPTPLILDAKFGDDSILLILLQLPLPTKVSLLLSLPYTPQGNLLPSDPIKYTWTPSANLSPSLLPSGTPVSSAYPSAHVHISESLIAKHTLHVFDAKFTPLKLVVNGRRGRRAVVVLGSDRKHYRVLDLDYKERRGVVEQEKGRKEEREEEEEDESSEGSDIEMVEG